MQPRAASAAEAMRAATAGPPPLSAAALQTLQSTVGNRAAGGVIQRRTAGASEPTATVHAAAKLGISEAGGALPHLAQIQRSFGAHDVSNVVAHTGPQASRGARAMGAAAFATGNHVAFDGAPSLHMAAHEAAHVVQQRAGVQLTGGVGQVGDRYERHADAVADAVVQGKSVEAMLSRHAGAGVAGAALLQRRINVNHHLFNTGTQAKGLALNDEDHLEREADDWGERAADGQPVPRAGTASLSGSELTPDPETAIVQRAPQRSDWGTFTDTKYELTQRGVEMALAFEPGSQVETKKIGLTQTVESRANKVPQVIDPGQSARTVKAGPGEGSRIDRLSKATNPIYGAPDVASGNLSDTPEKGSNAKYQLGHRYMDGPIEKKQNATLHDSPKSNAATKRNSSQVFETTALALEGAQSGFYYGSVRWGWTTDDAGKLEKVDFALASPGHPTSGFLAAATLWNTTTARSIAVTTHETPLLSSDYREICKLDKDVNVELDATKSAVSQKGINYNVVTVKSGPHSGKNGRVATLALEDRGTGEQHIKLPIPREEEEEEAQTNGKPGVDTLAHSGQQSTVTPAHTIEHAVTTAMDITSNQATGEKRKRESDLAPNPNGPPPNPNDGPTAKKKERLTQPDSP